MRIAKSHDAEVCLPADWREQVAEAIYLDETRPGSTALDVHQSCRKKCRVKAAGVQRESGRRVSGEAEVQQRQCDHTATIHRHSARELERGWDLGESGRRCQRVARFEDARDVPADKPPSGLGEGSQYPALAGRRGSAANLAQLNTGQVQEELLDGISPLPGEDRLTMLSGDALLSRRRG